MDIAFIYCLSDPVTGEIRYVGKAFNIEARLTAHISEKNHTYKCRWVIGLRSRGLKPVIEILETIAFEQNEEWEKAERWWISYLRFIGCELTNMTDGGDKGRRICAEVRRKMSEGNRGKVRTPEMLARYSAARKGIPRPKWVVEKVAASMRGKTHTDETKQKMSATRKGRKQTPEWVAKRTETMLATKLAKLST